MDGTFSWVKDAQLVITDEQGCYAWAMEKTIPEYARCDENTAYYYGDMKERFKKVLINGIEMHAKKTLPLDAIMGPFNELPLIGYWQKGVCMFLRDLAQFVEGDVTWELEDQSRVAELVFERKDVVVREGIIKWNPDASLEELSGMPKLPKREQFTRAL